MDVNSSNADDGIDFCTLGMFIIGRYTHLMIQIPMIDHTITDDIYPPETAPDQTPQLNVIGGAGTYSAIGARLLSPPPQSHTVGWIIDAGTDFPPPLHHTITSWSTSALIRPRSAPTTRGWNGYSSNQHRAFRYLTEKKRLTASDLTPSLLASKSFHLICSPARCISLVEDILSRRQQELETPDTPRPLVIWEPVPDLCTPAERQKTLQALAYVDVVSPNHEELASIFDFSHADGVDKRAVEEHAQRCLDGGIGPDRLGVVVVRAGAEGCFALSSTVRRWLPAYHQDASKVVDPTGGGNGFLGGLAVGLVRSGMDVIEAARWGSVAASFCIEQVGMPRLTSMEPETWNGVDVSERLEQFRRRTG